MMQDIEDPKLCLPRRVQDLHHIVNTVFRFGNALQAVSYSAPFGNEVVSTSCAVLW